MKEQIVILSNTTARRLKITEGRFLVFVDEYGQPEYNVPICKKLNVASEFMQLY